VTTAAPRTARERARVEITREILDTAREHLVRDGAASLSLRAVARDLGMVSSAVYRYVPNRDTLLTMLIVDAYDSLGEAVEGAEALVPRDRHLERFLSTCQAVRVWALAHPHEYALIYGSPVPGYAAPVDTIAPASRVPIVLVTILNRPHGAGAHLRPSRLTPTVHASTLPSSRSWTAASPTTSCCVDWPLGRVVRRRVVRALRAPHNVVADGVRAQRRLLRPPDEQVGRARTGLASPIMGHADAEHVRFESREQWRVAGRSPRDCRWSVGHLFKKAPESRRPPMSSWCWKRCASDGSTAGPKVDAERTKLYFCPRKKGSVWAATNKARVVQLAAEGLMTPAGQALVEQAKADGS
jgi:AcrR family transcriptional regulator